VEEPVNRAPQRRRYDASRRRAAAQENRRAIGEAARTLFLERGYVRTTMAAIAEAAGVSHETVYASLGPKPAVFRHLVETALSGADEPVHPLERDYARRVLAERDATRVIDLYAHAMRLIQERVAPLMDVLNQAATADAGLHRYRAELIERRAHYTGVYARHLAELGGLRDDLSVQAAADVLFALNSSEFFLLLARDRGWPTDEIEAWLAAAWKRLLFPAPGGDAGDQDR
jgi:AcrR family transcriptional regulator